MGDVDWVALHGPYENAIAVPALLRALPSADHGRFVHRATLTELARGLILPATDGWRWMTPELKSVYAASSALNGRRLSEVPYLATAQSHLAHRALRWEGWGSAPY